MNEAESPEHTEHHTSQTQTLRPNPSSDYVCCPPPKGSLGASPGGVFENSEGVRPNGVTASTHTLRQRPSPEFVCCPLPDGSLSACPGRVFENFEGARPNEGVVNRTVRPSTIQIPQHVESDSQTTATSSGATCPVDAVFEQPANPFLETPVTTFEVHAKRSTASDNLVNDCCA